MEIRHIVFLLVFFILYVIFGGLVFMLLESPEEQIKRQEIQGLLNEFTEHIKQINHPNITEQYFRVMIHEILVAQDNNLIDSHGHQKSYINWSFINSFFFAITVITTIGYGHLTPSTVFGKIFCIIYALFGIPITSLLIGSVADRFSKLYSPKAILRNKSHYQRQMSARLLMLKKGLISLVPWFFAFLVVPAIIFTCIEEWDFLDGFYYCFVTLSTIGFGDFVAGSFDKDYIWIYKILVVFWIIFGLAYLSMVLNFITHSLRSRHISNVVHSLRHRISATPSSRMRRHREECHPQGRFKRQQSSPLVLFSPPNQKMFTKEGLNNNYLNAHDDLKQCSPDCHQISSVQVENDTGDKPSQRVSFWKLIKSIKNKSILQQRPQRNKTSIQRAFEESSAVRQSNSLPDLTDVECSDPCCSINVTDAKMTIV